MNRELQISKLVPIIIEPDQIGLDIEAALNENDEDVDFAVPNVAFEVRIGVQKIYEGRSDPTTGIFVAKNIPVDKFGPSFEVVISAKDEVCGLTVRVQIDVTSVMEEIEDGRKKVKEKVRAAARGKTEKATPPTPVEVEVQRSLAEEAEHQRQIKSSIDKALNVVSQSHYKSDVEESYKILLSHKDHPAVRRGMMRAAQENPENLIPNIECFVDAQWAEEVIGCIAEKQAGAVLDRFPIFYKFPWAKNTVMKIAKGNPEIAFEKIGQYEYQPWAENVAVETAKRNPNEAIKNFGRYQDQPWAKLVIAEAAKIDPKSAFSYFHLYKNEEWASAIMKEVEPKFRAIDEEEMRVKERIDTLAMAQNNPDNLVSIIHKYVDKPWAEEMVLILAKQPVSKLLEVLSKYKGYPWIKKAVREAVASVDWQRDYLLKYYLDEPWIEDAVSLSICMHEQIYITWLRPCVDKPWALKLILEAMEKQKRDICCCSVPNGVGDYDDWRQGHIGNSIKFYQEALKR